MLKQRLIPVLFIKNGLIVRSENFESHKIIGNVVNEVRRYNQWDIDELIYIDISREAVYDSRRDDHKIQSVSSIDEILEIVSKECFMPLSFGGGIRDFETIKKILKNGADKVVINTMLHESPEEVKRAVNLFGAQAVIASIDYRLHKGIPTFYKNYGKTPLEFKSFKEIITYIEKLDCGEIFLNAMDNDGQGEGYDIESVKEVVAISNLPVIGCGGAIDILDFEDLASIQNLSGIAAGNMFHFTENIYPRSKTKLKTKNLNFR